MITFITVNEVDALLGDEWADASKKAESVLMANVWLNWLSLKLCDNEMPEDVILAGSYAARAASKGGLYQQKTDSGSLLSKSVDADGVSVSKTFSELDVNSTSLLNSDLQLAMAILKPYGLSTSQTRVLRG